MIELNNITKRYRKFKAIDNLSLTIKDNGIYCLLGRNGAGKTTLMKILAGHFAPTSGETFVNGRKVDTLNMPDLNFIELNTPFFNMKISKMIEFSHNFSSNFDREFAFKIANKFKLDLNKKYKELSLGMKTMTAAILSLASGSNIIILDEPVLGFDPVVRTRFYELLREAYAMKPKIIIISTHIIDEIEKTADSVIIIEKGKILDRFGMSDFYDNAYKITGFAEQVKIATDGFKTIYTFEDGGFCTAFVYDKRAIEIADLTVKPLGLQDFFINLVGGMDI